MVTLRDAIGNLPKLDAVKNKNIASSFHHLHTVSIMDPKKYLWIKHTKEGDSAFNNQCINPKCLYQDNVLHGTNSKNWYK